MTENEFLTLCEKSFAQNGISEYNKDEILKKLYELSVIFAEANAVMNLTAIKDEALVISRHFADCLIPAALLPEGAKIIDIGSGGGMPALPIAIARPDVTVFALDATEKKTAYIESAAKKLGLSNVRVITGRAEELAHTPIRETFDVAIARAVAELRILAEWCVPYVKPGGKFIALKGKRTSDELDAAQNALKTLSCKLIATDDKPLYDIDGTVSERHALVFEKTAKTSPAYPRKNAQIQKKPL